MSTIKTLKKLKSKTYSFRYLNFWGEGGVIPGFGQTLLLAIAPGRSWPSGVLGINPQVRSMQGKHLTSYAIASST